MVEQRTENPRVEGSSPPPTTIFIMEKSSSKKIITTALIAAIYASCTLVCNLVLPVISWGLVQIRISEAICVVALFTPLSIPGLTIGCVIANLCNVAISGTGILGMFDVVFGSLATCIGAIICWKLRHKKVIAIGAFVLTNAIIIPAYLPFLMMGAGIYTIPFTDIALDGAYVWMYLFGVVSLAIGEAFSVFVLGIPLSNAISVALKDRVDKN